MKRELPKYSKYKPSGVDWIGEVPEEWTLTKLRFFVQTRKGVAFKASDFREEGTLVVKATHIKNCTIIKGETYLPHHFVSSYPKAVLKSGEIVLSTVGSRPEVLNSAVGQIGVIPQDLDGALLNQNTVVFTPSSKVYRPFLFYVLNSQAYRKHLDIHAHGTANQASLNIGDMLEFSCPLPRKDEQQTIVAFLNRETTKIDRLIQVRREQMERLHEQRSAVIHHAVTKGLDPNARMKPSGVEWLGEIPETWKIVRLKFLAHIRNGQAYKQVEADDGYPVIGSGGQFAYASRYLYSGESVLLGRKGTINRPLYMNSKFWTVDTAFYTEMTKNISAKFLYYCALGFPYEYYSTQTALPSLTQQDLGNHPLAVPPIEQQQTIIAYIENETKKIDAPTDKYRREIVLLEEYRTALISHAVTGKIDVRGLLAAAGAEASVAPVGTAC